MAYFFIFKHLLRVFIINNILHTLNSNDMLIKPIFQLFNCILKVLIRVIFVFLFLSQVSYLLLHFLEVIDNIFVYACFKLFDIVIDNVCKLFILVTINFIYLFVDIRFQLLYLMIYSLTKIIDVACHFNYISIILYFDCISNVFAFLKYFYIIFIYFLLYIYT